jgi:hypothetical protein
MLVRAYTSVTELLAPVSLDRQTTAQGLPVETNIGSASLP